MTVKGTVDDFIELDHRINGVCADTFAWSMNCFNHNSNLHTSINKSNLKLKLNDNHSCLIHRGALDSKVVYKLSIDKLYAIHSCNPKINIAYTKSVPIWGDDSQWNLHCESCKAVLYNSKHGVKLGWFKRAPDFMVYDRLKVKPILRESFNFDSGSEIACYACGMTFQIKDTLVSVSTDVDHIDQFTASSPVAKLMVGNIHILICGVTFGNNYIPGSVCGYFNSMLHGLFKRELCQFPINVGKYI